MKVREEVPEVDSKPTAIKFAGIQGFFWFTMATGGFVSAYLLSLGYSALQIGIVNALNACFALIAAPLWGLVSDRFRSARNVFLFVICTAIALCFFIPSAARITMFGLPLTFLLIPCMSFFREPADGLLDSWAVTNSYKHGWNSKYDFIRCAGSLGWVVACIGVSFLVKKTGYETIFHIAPLCLIPLAVLILTTHDVETFPDGRKSLTFKELEIGSLFKSYHYICFLILVLCAAMANNCAYNFIPYLMKNLGLDTTKYGLVIAWRAFSEIPALLICRKLRKKVPLQYLIMASTCLFIVEKFLSPMATSLPGLIFSNTFQGLGNGMFMSACVNYIYILAPGQLKATAQTVYKGTVCLANILCNLIGGMLVGSIGIRSYYDICGCIIIVGAVLFIVLFNVGDRILKIKRPTHIGYDALQ